MENASDAIKMAGAIFIFIIALTILFSLMATTKESADQVLYNSDKTNFYATTEGTLDKRKTSYSRYNNFSII